MSDCICMAGGKEGDYLHSDYCPVGKDQRIAELEAEVKRWQQQSNKHYIYSCELDKTVADLNEELAAVRRMVEHVAYYSLDNMPPDVRAAAQALLQEKVE